MALSMKNDEPHTNNVSPSGETLLIACAQSMDVLLVVPAIREKHCPAVCSYSPPEESFPKSSVFLNGSNSTFERTKAKWRDHVFTLEWVLRTVSDRLELAVALGGKWRS